MRRRNSRMRSAHSSAVRLSALACWLVAVYSLAVTNAGLKNVRIRSGGRAAKAEALRNG